MSTPDIVVLVAAVAAIAGLGWHFFGRNVDGRQLRCRPSPCHRLTRHRTCIADCRVGGGGGPQSATSARP